MVSKAKLRAWVIAAVLAAVVFISLLLAGNGHCAGGVTAPVVVDPSRLVTQISPGIVLRPSMTVLLLRFNFRDNDLSFGVVPGVGYSLTYKKVVGVDIYANLVFSRNGQPDSFGLSLIGSVMKYLSLGIMTDFRSGKKPDYSLIFGGAIPLALY